MNNKSNPVNLAGVKTAAGQLKDIFHKAISKRESLYPVTNAVRLFNSAADGVPGLLIEQYHNHFVVKKLLPAHDLDITFLLDVIVKHFSPEYLVVKSRSRTAVQDGSEPFISEVIIDKAGSHTVVTENGIKFDVDVNDNYNAGLFLDMRSKRKMIAEIARGKTLLNCFAYTCSFGVYGRYSEALKTVNIDISKKSLERGQVNYTLNGLTFSADEFIRTDCMKYLKGAGKWQNYFDIIIIDPPTFARSGKKVFIVQKELPDLIAAAMAVLNPGGTLLAATNCSALTEKEVEHMFLTSLAPNIRKSIKIKRLEAEPDFPGSRNMKESHLTAVIAIVNTR